MVFILVRWLHNLFTNIFYKSIYLLFDGIYASAAALTRASPTSTAIAASALA